LKFLKNPKNYLKEEEEKIQKDNKRKKFGKMGRG